MNIDNHHKSSCIYFVLINIVYIKNVFVDVPLILVDFSAYVQSINQLVKNLALNLNY
jgi:hypothetical protein